MNAYQPSRPPVQPIASRQVPHPRKSRRRGYQPHQAIAFETTAKLTVNFAISAIAVAGLAQLIPYQWIQQDRLHEINQEVNLAEDRVNKLQTDFGRYFDPQQTRSVMQEQSNLFNPGQHQVILVDKAATSK